MKPIIYLNSHPIQYFTPLYKKIANETDIDITVWYCSDKSIKGDLDKEFGKKIIWDIPMLEGYKYIFFKNSTWKKTISTDFWSLINFGILIQLFKIKKSVIIIYGWYSFTHLFTVFFGKLLGHTICLRAETPLCHEKLKKPFNAIFKKFFLKIFFFFIDKFLYIGNQNKLFYEYMGIENSKLFAMLYCVDNDRFSTIYNSNTKQYSRNKLGLHAQKKIILFSGKYVSKKRPMDLLKSYLMVDKKDTLLVFVGEGELRGEMESFIKSNNLTENVILTGFINQSLIPYYYSASDLFVMCSDIGETWGLSVNEAMNFGLPIIISDLCGSAFDLVEKGKNGYIFKTGDTVCLTEHINQILSYTIENKKIIGEYSINIINKYSYEQNIECLKKILK